MWQNLPINQKDEYKKLILAFSSLTEMFAQKSIDDDTLPTPVVNSKFQETVFQKAFNAFAEDIGNTSYDVSLILKKQNSQTIKYLIGIKTFGFNSKDQKIAQFKANNNEWNDLISTIKNNSININNKDQILESNKDIYLELAQKIATIRNARISSSRANLKGFDINEDDIVKAVYHILMPHIKDNEPKIYVGETDYTQIDIDNIKILGCTSASKPENFTFTDGIHTYKYTPADSQLYMRFDNENIVEDEWQVVYAKNAYEIFKEIANKVYNQAQVVNAGIIPKIAQSISWKIKLQSASGFNSFYGIGLKKQSKGQRHNSIEYFNDNFKGKIKDEILKEVVNKLKLLANSTQNDFAIRDEILNLAITAKDDDFIDALKNLLFRPINEIYIPIPQSKKFHEQNPNFFGKDIGALNDDDTLKLPKEKQCFDLVFDPSGTKIKAFITQDSGKAIQSYEKQSELGKWILREIFQLKEYEPLTQDKLDKIGINGIRLYKLQNDENVYFQFIYLDDSNLPKDYFNY